MNSGANAGYGYHFKGCILGQYASLYDEGNGLGVSFEDCLDLSVIGLESNESGTGGDKRSVSVTGTLWSASGTTNNLIGLSIFSSIASHTSLYVSGITSSHISGLISETGAGSTGCDISNAGNSTVVVTQYVTSATGTRYKSTSGGLVNLRFVDLNQNGWPTPQSDIVAKAFDSDLFNAAALTDEVAIWTQPANSVLIGVKIALATQFDSTSDLVSDLDITIGDSFDVDRLLAPAAMNLISDAADTSYTTRGADWKGSPADAGDGSWGNFVSWRGSAKTYTAYVTAVGANLNTLTAGKVLFYFQYIQL
jgi:hypothetical protein